MNWLLETTPEQLTLLAALAAAAVILSLVWLRLGKRLPIALAAVAGALIVVVLLASHLIDTDREIVERTLRQIAADVERNDADAVVRHIHRRRTDLIGVAESELQKYEFEQIDIKSNLTIEVESASNPPTAVAKFNVVVRGKLQGGGDVGAVYGDEGVRRYVVVEFQQEEGAWKVIDFEHFRPIAHGQ